GALLTVRGELQRGEQRRGIIAQYVGTTALVHRSGTGEQRIDVDADECSRQQSDGGEHAEPSTDVRWNRQCGYAFVIGELAQYAVLRIRREDQVAALAVRVALEGGAQHVPHDQVLRHRLRGRAGLADDVEQRATHVEA